MSDPFQGAFDARDREMIVRQAQGQQGDSRKSDEILAEIIAKHKLCTRADCSCRDTEKEYPQVFENTCKHCILNMARDMAGMQIPLCQMCAENNGTIGNNGDHEDGKTVESAEKPAKTGVD